MDTHTHIYIYIYPLFMQYMFLCTDNPVITDTVRKV